MSFAYRLRLGGYSLDTQIRLQSPFKVRGLKVATDATVTLSEKNPSGKILQDSPPSPAKFKREDVVKEGPVRVKECGIHPRDWFFTIKWLVLYEDRIALHVSQTKAHRSFILLANVDKLERTARLPCGLSLQTKDRRRFLLSFEKDSDLYGWQDEISRRSMGVGLPHNFKHNTHAFFDVTTGRFMGLPDGWTEALLALNHHGLEEPEPQTALVTMEKSNGLEELEPERSLVIKVPVSKIEYKWRIQSSTENLQDILESVCLNLGLPVGENVLVLAGDEMPLAGTVADLQGKRELEIVARTADETVDIAPPRKKNSMFIRIKVEDHTSVHIATAIPVTGETKIQDLLQRVCRKTKLDAHRYRLWLPDGVEPLGLTSTVDELKGERQLRLTPRGVGSDPLTIAKWNAVAESFIHLRISLDEIPLSTLSVAPQMQIQDILRDICSQVQHPASEYTLSIAGCAEPLAMERTAASLEGNYDLVLSRRDVEVTPGAQAMIIRVSLRISPDETFLGDVSATSQMQLKDVLLRICAKMKFRASDYTLAFLGSVEPLSMDLTVADLDGKHELVLLKCTTRTSRTPEAWWYSTDPPKLLCGSQSADA